MFDFWEYIPLRGRLQAGSDAEMSGKDKRQWTGDRATWNTAHYDIREAAEDRRDKNCQDRSPLNWQPGVLPKVTQSQQREIPLLTHFPIKLEYNIGNGQLSDVTGSVHVMGRYLANAIVSDKSKWRK